MPDTAYNPECAFGDHGRGVVSRGKSKPARTKQHARPEVEEKLSPYIVISANAHATFFTCHHLAALDSTLRSMERNAKVW